MENKQFSFDSVLGFGWRTMTKNIWFFVGIFLTILVVSYTPVVIQLLIEHSSMEKSIVNTLNYTIMVISQIINFIITIGLIKIALSFCDEVKPTFSTLFDFWGCFWRYVGGAVLYILIIIAGYLLLIVPGVIWTIKFRFFAYFIVDKGLGPIAALKASSRTTNGIKVELYGLMIIFGLIILAGYACLVVGIFAATPIVLVANALVYRQLAAQTPELSEFGINSDAAEMPVNDNF